MRVIEQSGEATAVELTTDELRISNAINEICNGPDAIEDDGFDTRIGASRQEAEALLDGLRCVSQRQGMRLARVTLTPDPQPRGRLMEQFWSRADANARNPAQMQPQQSSENLRQPLPSFATACRW
jgi:hypothetical protein